jgi:hypothetical protein
VAALAAVALAGAAFASMRPSINPANDPRLLNKPIEGSRYDWATRCRSPDRIPPGMTALAGWLIPDPPSSGRATSGPRARGRW